MPTVCIFLSPSSPTCRTSTADLRVSAVQSGNWSGPVGSTRGQQPFRPGLVVAEAQPTQWGFTPHYGHIEVTCRGQSQPTLHVLGVDGRPGGPTRALRRICLVEIFGHSVLVGTDGVRWWPWVVAFIGSATSSCRGVLRRPVSAGRQYLHRYAVDWQPGGVDFFVDDVRTMSVGQAPDYPIQLIIGVFDFPTGLCWTPRRRCPS